MHWDVMETCYGKNNRGESKMEDHISDIVDD